MAETETWTARRELLVVPGPGEDRRPPKRTARRYARLGVMMAITDALAIDAALLFTRMLRGGPKPYTPDFLMLLVFAPILWVAVFAAFRLYAASRLTAAEEFRLLIEATMVVVGLNLVLSPVLNQVEVVSRTWVGVTWVVALALVLALRKGWHKQMGRLRKRGDLLFRTLIVGANEEAVKIAEALQRPQSGFVPVGMVGTDFGWATWNGLPVLGSLHELSRLIDEHDVECVFLASSAVGPDQMKTLTKYLRRHPVEVRISANMTDILASRLTVHPVGNLLALSLRPVRLTGSQAAAKRAFDVSFASIGLIATAPVWLVIAALIKATSRGPVLFRQERVGKGGQPFTIYKFRTMVRGADLMLQELAERNEATGPLFKMRKDPRITRVGGWIRRWSLDELPQILNVLKGDMSLVGPRPPLPNEVARYEDWHRDRLEVRPGITGLWQVGGRSELGFDDYVRLDLFYIENWSITYDVFLIFKTIPAVLTKKGAY